MSEYETYNQEHRPYPSEYAHKSYPQNVQMASQNQPGMFDQHEYPSTPVQYSQHTAPVNSSPKAPKYKSPALPFQKPAERQQPVEYVPQPQVQQYQEPQPVRYSIPKYQAPQQQPQPVQYQFQQQPVYYQPVEQPQVHYQPVEQPQVHYQPVEQPQVHYQPVEQPQVHYQPVEYQQVHHQPVQYQQVHRQPVEYQPVEYQQPQYVHHEEIKAAPYVEVPRVKAPRVEVKAPKLAAPKLTAPKLTAPKIEADATSPQYYMEQPEKTLKKKETVIPQQKTGKITNTAPRLIAAPVEKPIPQPKIAKTKMTAPKLQAPTVKAPTVQAPTIKAPIVKAPKVEVKAPKVEVKKPTLPKGFKPTAQIMAQTDVAPQNHWNTKMTTGPKKAKQNIPMMGLSAPEHAPLEYPEDEEEEQYREPSFEAPEQYYREPLEEAPKQHFIQRKEYQEAPQIYEQEPIYYEPIQRNYSPVAPKLKKKATRPSPVRPQWNTSKKADFQEYSPRKQNQVKQAFKPQTFSRATVPYKPTLRSPRRSPARQTWQRQSGASPDLNQGWKNQDFQDAGYRPNTGNQSYQQQQYQGY